MSLKNLIGWIVVFILIGPFVAYGLGNFIGSYDAFVVTSGSMEPEIKTGAILYTIPTEPENIDVGDTITFQDDDHFTTHEVIDKSREDGRYSFKTKGIANDEPDQGRVNEDDIAGKELFSIPYLGRLVMWADTFAGTIVLVVMPATVILISEATKVWKEVSSNEKQEGEDRSGSSMAPAVAIAGILLLLSAIVVIGWRSLEGFNPDYNHIGVIALIVLGLSVLALEFY